MLFYRVSVLGRPKGPWRANKRQAHQDAIELGLGEYDEWGKFFVSVPADIEALHENFLRKRA